MQHIIAWPADYPSYPCTHKPTAQRYFIASEPTNIETPHGTMTARPGDAIMLGVDGRSVYCLAIEAFRAAYIDGEEPK